MIDQIVSLLRSVNAAVVSFAATLFNATGTWSLVFAGFSVVMISRFILGPILGFTGSGASDVVSGGVSEIRKGHTKRQNHKYVEQARYYKKMKG